MGDLANKVRAKQQEELDNLCPDTNIIGITVAPAPYGMQVYKKYEITGDPKSKTNSPTKTKKDLNNSIDLPSSQKKDKFSPEIIKVDESHTITLIEQLDAESKRTLNALVQSVLLTQ
jgi:hypothetical protein